jgi:hypothetical protein
MIALDAYTFPLYIIGFEEREMAVSRKQVVHLKYVWTKTMKHYTVK